MTELNIRKTGEDTADFDLPQGCPVCGGTVSIRLTPRDAHSYCAACKWIARPQVQFNQGGLQIAYPTVAQA
ncbi:MAG: hypothetical protein IRZ16_00235 [Myxococcaceae bacterium]|nr:hypothetical protein [Myxococcaceae bacterium]